MTLLRRHDYPEGKFTLAFVGYGPESEQAAIELTHNWGTDRYELGTGFGHVALEVPDAAAACAEIKRRGGVVTREAGPMKHGTTVIAFVQDPGRLQDRADPAGAEAGRRGAPPRRAGLGGGAGRAAGERPAAGRRPLRPALRRAAGPAGRAPLHAGGGGGPRRRLADRGWRDRGGRPRRRGRQVLPGGGGGDRRHLHRPGGARRAGRRSPATRPGGSGSPTRPLRRGRRAAPRRSAATRPSTSATRSPRARPSRTSGSTRCCRPPTSAPPPRRWRRAWPRCRPGPASPSTAASGAPMPAGFELVSSEPLGRRGALLECWVRSPGLPGSRA